MAMERKEAIVDEIRARLLERQEELRRRVSTIAAGAGRGTPLDPDFEEQAVERQQDEVLDALDEAARRELARIRHALARMEQGEYGACAVCGADIPVGRLRAVPYTDLCVACAEERD